MCCVRVRVVVMVCACVPTQGAVRSVAPFFPGVPPSHFGATPEQMFYIQLTLGFFIADSLFVRGSTPGVAVLVSPPCRARWRGVERECAAVLRFPVRVPPTFCSPQTQLAKDWKTRGSAMMVVHHLLFPLSYGVGLYVLNPPFGVYGMAVFQLCEVTTPFLHIRWFLSTLGMKSSKAYLYNGLVFTFLFIAVRGVLMTFMFNRMWFSGTVPSPWYWPDCGLCTLVMSCGWGFMALQYVWCVKVVSGSLAFLKTSKKEKQ